MINVDSSQRRGIYKNLYTAINEQGHIKKETEQENFTARMPKGIYKDLYKNIEKNTAKETSNIWHKYPLKLLVYSNDFGEATRPIIGNALARFSWIPAIFYTTFALKSGTKKEGLGKEVAFQVIASFLMPFALIKTSRTLASKTIDKMSPAFKKAIKSQTAKIGIVDKIINKFSKKNSSGHRNLALSAVSIGALAVGVKPIDNYVKKTLDANFS